MKTRLIIACRAIDNMAGGVERQALSLLNEMSKRGYEARLLTFDEENAKAFYPLDTKVCWYKLNIGSPKEKSDWIKRWKRFKKLRSIIKEFSPDIILAFQHGMFISLFLYLIGLKIRVIAAERESPFRFEYLKAGKYRELIFQTFRLANLLTVQCQSYVAAYPKYLHSKIVVVPNAILPQTQFAVQKNHLADKRIILCVGRLGYQKNQLVLLRAFSQIQNDFKNWDLVLAGEGEGRAEIEDYIKKHSLSARVKLLGAVKDVSKLYLSAHLFCMPSRWEGFPNALGEAFAHGLPAVGFAGCAGVSDLIRDGEGGLLAEGEDDYKSLSSALKIIMADNKMRKECAKNAIKYVKNFHPNIIYDEWENIFQKVQNH